MSQTFQIRRRVGAQQRQTNSTDRYLWNILQLSVAFRRPLSFGNITNLEQRFLFQKTFMCVCCVSGKFVWKVVTNGSVLWQLSLTSSFFLSHLIPTVDPIERLLKDSDKEKTETATRKKQRQDKGQDKWVCSITNRLPTSSFFLPHLISSTWPHSSLFMVLSASQMIGTAPLRAKSLYTMQWRERIQMSI